MTTPSTPSERFDRALSARLRQLDATPVDTTALDRALRNLALAAPAATRRIGWMPRLVAMAAALLIVGSVALIMMTPREVLASPTEIAAMHQSMMSNTMPMMKAENAAEVNAAIHAQWNDFPGIPQSVAGIDMGMHKCCIGKMKDARMAFVMLDVNGKSVSMAVAKAREIASPKADVVVRDGNSFTVQKVGDLNMVMTEHGPRWICLTGDLPAEKLTDLAVKFLKD